MSVILAVYIIFPFSRNSFTFFEIITGKLPLYALTTEVRSRFSNLGKICVMESTQKAQKLKSIFLGGPNIVGIIAMKLTQPWNFFKN